MSEPFESAVSKVFLPVNSTIVQTISNLEASHLKIALVVTEDKILVGTITDGDIRRGLLRGLNINSPIDTIICRNPLVVPPVMSREMVIQLMQANKVLQLPVVDENRKVIGLHLWDELAAPPARPTLMVIMAGGLGTRLLPHTENCPKPLLPVAGKPILEHIINRAKAEGFENFVLAIHYLGQMIEDYFGNGERWQVRIEYLHEPLPLGTAGALALLNPRPDAPFIVTNGDVISDIRYGELLDFHICQAAAATMAVRLHEWQHPFGVVETQGIEIVGFEEKPIARTHINAGVYALEPSSLDVLNPTEHCDMPILFQRLQGKGRRTVAYPLHEPWLDVGYPLDLIKAGSNDEKL
jgi:dTDP-glucose pyrophosphorylase